MAEDSDTYLENPKDSRTYLDQLQSRSVDRNDRELTPTEMAKQFAKADEDTRVDILQRIKADGGGALTLDEAVKLYAFEGALKRTNKLLNRAAKLKQAAK